jgi:hypothetical protein
MTRPTITLLVIACSILLSTSGAFGQTRTDGAVTYIKDSRRLPDAGRQAELRALAPWQQFVGENPRWAVEFNESSGKPRRAFGPPIATAGNTAEEQAMDFIGTHLQRFGLPVNGLVHQVTLPTGNATFVHFRQQHQGLPVLQARLLVKLDAQGRVISFATDVYDDITIDLMPMVSAAAAATSAVAGLSDVVAVDQEGLRILPIPAEGTMDHRLVHELVVRVQKGETPGRYRSWVDARSGELLYRTNEVVDHRSCSGAHDHDADDAGADGQFNATVQSNGPLQPTEVKGLPDLRISVNGNFLFTDQDGLVNTGIPGPVSAQVQLRGRWSNVTTNNVTPSTTVTLEEGPNTIDLDAMGNIRERSAYYAVNAIHGHMKTVLPTFTGMDIVLPTKVDLTGGDCNAFYDGSSINFYAEANGCRSLALVPDVVFHEYGHGINDKFYQGLSSSFQNGAMNEGYADVWALTLTQNPVLALGWQTSSNTTFIRRYDAAPKVYPVDLVGQVHADGEIIAGAWWSTYQLLGDLELTLSLFADAFPGLQAAVANGQEGMAYRDVLIDVLQADDDDGDITNGTPNGTAIVDGFARHGITLLSNVSLQHTAITTAVPEEGIPVSATVNVTFPFNSYLNGVRAFYRTTDATAWESVLMTNTGGSQYEAAFPAYPTGTLLAYYIAVEDIFGQLSSVKPVGAAQSDPNLPYYILVGFELRATEDGDLVHQLGNWTSGLPTDNATSGQWEQNVPVPSYSEANGAGVIVQPGDQTTPGGEFCWVTGNASGPFAGMGENDVDGGVTTLISGDMDLTAYTIPTFTYQRWYVNNPPGGANPNADWWQVYVSNNSGSTWVPVENTKTSDRSWRKAAFRVQDFVTPSANFRIKFMASDSTRAGQNLNGGSLLEAAVDDVQLWDASTGIGMEEIMPVVIAALYPSPADRSVQVLLTVDHLRDLRMEVLDMLGRVVATPQARQGSSTQEVDVQGLADGQYVLRLTWDGGRTEKRFSVVR